MAAKPLPDQQTLLKLLRYDPQSGKLYWKKRTPEFFQKSSNPKSACLTWNKRYAGKEAFTARDEKGTQGSVLGVHVRAHRVIWCMIYGDWPPQIDHENQDPWDNRIGNLQLTNHSHNGRNCHLSKRNSSGRVGVNWRSRASKWRAKIRHGGRYIELGLFERFEDACAARDNAERLYGYSPNHGKRPRT